MSMWIYFKPLRRKVGVAMLVIACLFSAAWVRSTANVDLVWVHSQPFQMMLISGEQSLHFPVADMFREMNIVMEEPTETSLEIRLISRDEVVEGPIYHRWFSWPKAQVHVVQNDSEGNRRIIMIPYWTIVMPLTLLSAWLLLSKPRASKRKPGSEF